MIKLIFAAAHTPRMTQQEYREYVSKVHGPLVVSTPDVVAPMLSYVQHFAVPAEDREPLGVRVAPDRHNVVVMEMTSFEAMAASLQSRQYQEIIKPDEKRFEHPDVPVLVHFVEERLVLPEQKSGIKLFHFIRRARHFSREKFQHSWAERQKQLLPRRESSATRGYIQNFVLPDGALPFGVADDGIDLIDEYSFQDLEGLSMYSQEFSASGADLIDSARSFAVVSEPVPILNRLS